MSETSSLKETKEIEFNHGDLSPFEHTMIGSSGGLSVNLNGETVLSGASTVERLFMDKKIRKLLLSPTCLTESKRTLEEVIRLRARSGAVSGMLSFFEMECMMNLLREEIYPAFEPGKLDQNGQLTAFEIYLLQKDHKIVLPKDVEKKLIVNAGFKKITEYLGHKDNAMKFRIRTEL